MSNKMNSGKKTIITSFALAFIIALCLFRIIFVFCNYKEGHHSDESWSYGFANSFYYPYLYSDEIEILKVADNISNYDVWLDGKLFNDYLVVNEGEAFRFDSVIYNKKGDMSPPFYEIVLHLVSSFFPETFSWWYGFGINLVSFVLIELFIFLIGLELTSNRLFALTVTAFYGFGTGALSTVIYLRMYALLTLFTLVTVYLFLKYYKSRNIHWHYCLFFVVLTGLGAFTHYYYLLFAFFLTLFLCLFLLAKRQIKRSLVLGISMLGGVIIFFGLYPYALCMISGSNSMYDGKVQLPYIWSLNLCIKVLMAETVGIKWIVDKQFWYYVLAFLFILAVLVLGLSYVFRNEKWFIIKKANLGTKVENFFHNRDQKKNYFINDWCPLPLSLFLAVICSILIVAQISHVESMGSSSDRYMFNLFPIFLLTLFYFGLKIINRLKKGKGLVFLLSVAIMCGLLIRQNLETKDILYLFNKGDNKTDLEELLCDKDVIVASNSAFRMEWYAVPLRRAEKVIFIHPHDVKNAQNSLENPEDISEVYLIVESDSFVPEEAVDEENETVTFDSDDLNSWRGKYTQTAFWDDLQSVNPIFENKEFLFSHETFCGEIKIYKITIK